MSALIVRDLQLAVSNLLDRGAAEEAYRLLPIEQGDELWDVLRLRLLCLVRLRNAAHARLLLLQRARSSHFTLDGCACLLDFSGVLLSDRARRPLVKKIVNWFEEFGSRIPAARSANAAYTLARALVVLGDRSRLRRLLTGALNAGGEASIPAFRGLRRWAGLAVSDLSLPRIYGIGLSKTGTTSLARALTLLGYEVADWMNSHTWRMLRPADAQFFDALTDIPHVRWLEILVANERDALFINTERDFETWLESFEAHMARYYGLNTFEACRDAMRRPSKLNWSGEFTETLTHFYYRHDSYRRAFDCHQERVRRAFTGCEHRLLNLNICAGEGWKSLSAFIGVVEPHSSFPWSNGRAPRSNPTNLGR